MIYLLLTCIVLVIAVLTNSFSAWLQRRHKFYNHLGPTAWATHQFVIAPAWLVFFIMSSQLGNFINWHLSIDLSWLGWSLIIVAIIIFMGAMQLLGIQALTNGNLFGFGPKNKIKHGIYKYLNHPIYDSITLIYIAIALITLNGAYLLLALIFHLLLNHVQANLEKID